MQGYQDYDGGFVAFVGSSKGGRITGKGKIKTGKLDFKDVYFVKELKFNLFSVSQMCDKKNNVLFTKTECLVLSPDFKLLVESKDRLSSGVGSTSGIRACALRNFNLEVMELENTQNNALAKLPMLKLGEYEMWEIRIKQYFQIQDYALWEVIENGNSWVPIPVTSPAETGTSTRTKMTVPSTAKEKTCKKNDVK
ncbi:hypothetical protein Tco_0074689, partial [Tanacetum coccineum]